MEISEPTSRVSSTKIRYVTPKVDRTIQFQLISYFQTWLNFCYYLLLVPYKVEYNGSAYFIRTNKFQKILCSVLHPIICINGFFEIHEQFIGKVRQNPEIFMRGVDRLNAILLCLVFFNTVWFRKVAITTICNYSGPSILNYNKVKRIVRLCCFALLSISFAAFVVDTIGIESSKWTKTYQTLIQNFRFEYYFTKRIELENQYVPKSGLPVIGIAIAVFLRMYKWIMIDFIISLVLLVGFASYKMCKQFKLILMNSDSSGLDNLRILEEYSKLATLFSKLNDCIGPIIALAFAFNTTLYAVQTMDFLDSEDWSFRIFMFGYILFQGLGMIFSAEAHHQASYFKTWLLLRHQNDGSLMSLTRYLQEVEHCNLAVKGGRFFTITYSFLGTASSVILTYVIIMIQFGGVSNVTTT